MDAQAPRGTEYRHRERERAPRHLNDRLKTPVVYLLQEARVIQFHLLHSGAVIEIREGRVVERNVPVFADSHANQIDGKLQKHFGIAGADLGAIFFAR